MDFPLSVTSTITRPSPPPGKFTSPSFSNVKLDGTGKVFIDGVELYGVRSYNISRSAHEPVTMTLELFVNLLP